ncbi:ribosome biogenesis protein Nop53/GLTSCR2 [Achaetomium macrosporum]|uniref:Ribosome biogenesis protein NOP53 n=1 Tax=Achaetomium macrosporum TaxID=79813 RepID=A0AAN7CE56_9PEZI|nr:ribosome biogenesis protein Nop53/GLTSCR2 [Achaetomium macrosporum]
MPVLSAPSGNPNAPQQYKQPSRKGKKAWRKNVDISEVQQGLEELNDQIIKGGVIAEKESSELFTIDAVGDADLTKRFPKHVKRGLKADEIIAQRSALPAVSARKRPGDKTTDGILPVKRQRANYVTHKELSRIKKVADGHHDQTVEVVDAEYDVWAEPKKDPIVEQLPFLPKPETKKKPKTLEQQPISLAASGKPVPAVPKPKGGHSYNPAFGDYQERLIEESEKAVEAERKRLEALEAERQKREAAARSAAEAEAAEARADLSEWEDDSAWEGFESAGEELSVKAKRQRRKTQAERNRIKRRKEEERKAKHEAAMKRKHAQAERIKQIALEVAERERAMELAKVEMSDASEEEDDNVELRRKQLGKFKLPEKDLELVLPDELQDSLRLLKPEGNLLKDRYRNMLVRGKVEARRKIPFRKQAKTKVTEKWTYKDFTI